MYRKALYAILLLFSLPLAAQRGDELLVYAVKGNVTSLYKSKETPVKIGTVLLPGTIVKTEKDAELTMLCTKGRAITLNREGSFPVTKWKDSCKTADKSVSANYFKYIWSQLYAYSPEHKEEMRKRNEMAVSRGNETNPRSVKSKKPAKLEFSKGMDTVNYDGKSFPLSWNSSNYRGLYYFTLYEGNGKTILYTDTLQTSYIAIDSFLQLLSPGNRYRWTVSAKGVLVSGKKVLNYVLPAETARLTEEFLQPLPMPEDTAAIYFRTAFMLEQRHFFAEAFHWYQKATEQNPDMALYRDQVIRFRNEFWIR